MLTEIIPVCSKCGKSDKVEKVSSIAEYLFKVPEPESMEAKKVEIVRWANKEFY